MAEKKGIAVPAAPPNNTAETPAAPANDRGKGDGKGKGAGKKGDGKGLGPRQIWCQAFLRDGKCKFSPCKFAHLTQDQVDEIRRAHKESTERKDKQ